MSARLRPMRESDVPRIVAIERASFATPWTRGMFLDELVQGESRHWVVADSPWGILGYGGLMEADGEGHIMNLAVRPDARGKGLGTAMLSWLMGEARRRGLGRLTLEVRPSNAEAIDLFATLGIPQEWERPYGQHFSSIAALITRR